MIRPRFRFPLFSSRFHNARAQCPRVTTRLFHFTSNDTGPQQFDQGKGRLGDRARAHKKHGNPRLVLRCSFASEVGSSVAFKLAFKFTPPDPCRHHDLITDSFIFKLRSFYFHCSQRLHNLRHTVRTLATWSPSFRDAHGATECDCRGFAESSSTQRHSDSSAVITAPAGVTSGSL